MEITYDEVERIILSTEPAQLSDRGDKIWTRRMAVALADLFNSRIIPPSPARGGVEVKKLEWNGEEGGPGKDIWASPNAQHEYHVRHLRENDFDVILHTDLGECWFRTKGETHSSYQEAKSAAEADFRNRVIVCLSQAKESNK